MALLRCLRRPCKNKVVIRDGLALTCEYANCVAFGHTIPEETRHEVGSAYMDLISHYKTLPKHEVVAKREALAQQLADIARAISENDPLSDIQITIVYWFCKKNMHTELEDLWAILKWDRKTMQDLVQLCKE
jgi:hypothetical protein